MIPHKKSSKTILQNILPKISPKKFLQNKYSKKIPLKNSPQNSKNFPTISQKFFFEKIQFPTSHLEAENPFGLVIPSGLSCNFFKNFRKLFLKMSICGNKHSSILLFEKYNYAHLMTNIHIFSYQRRNSIMCMLQKLHFFKER